MQPSFSASGELTSRDTLECSAAPKAVIPTAGSIGPRAGSSHSEISQLYSVNRARSRSSLHHLNSTRSLSTFRTTQLQQKLPVPRRCCECFFERCYRDLGDSKYSLGYERFSNSFPNNETAGNSVVIIMRCESLCNPSHPFKELLYAFRHHATIRVGR